MIKPGKRDIKHLILITGQELTSLQALTGYMAESYGLDDRISCQSALKVDPLSASNIDPQ